MNWPVCDTAARVLDNSQKLSHGCFGKLTLLSPAYGATWKRNMAGSRVALAADDADLARSIQAYLEQHLGQAALQTTFARAQEYLDRDASGLLLIAAAGEHDTRAAVQLVQDICLQKLPPIVVLLDSE